MKLPRSVRVSGFVLGASLTLGITALLVATTQAILPRRLERRCNRKLADLAFGTTIWLAGGKIKVEGWEHFVAPGKFVVMCNHSSWLDIAVLWHVLGRYLRFAVKQELRSFPIVGKLLEKGGQFFLDRQSRRRSIAVYKEMADVMRTEEHDVSVVFPEGTTSDEDGKLGKIYTMACQMPIDAEMDIQPVVLKGCHDIAPGEKFVPRNTDSVYLYVIFCERVSTRGKDRKQVAREVTQRFTTNGVEKAT